MHCLGYLGLIPGSNVLGRQHIGPNGQSRKNRNIQIHHRTGAAHRCQSIAAGKPSHHNHVRGVEQLLQHGGSRQGQGK
jgi:hypothetical protein